jgi:hypothetical protein
MRFRFCPGGGSLESRFCGRWGAGRVDADSCMRETGLLGELSKFSLGAEEDPGSVPGGVRYFAA